MNTPIQRRALDATMRAANALTDLAEGIAMSQVRLLTSGDAPSRAYVTQADEALRRAQDLVTALQTQHDAFYRE